MRAIVRGAASIVLAGALAASLAACSNDPLADGAGDKGYIAADGFKTVEIAPADRGEPVEFAGTTEAGDELGSDDLLGKVAVVNFWYAECGPCRAEAPQLEKAHASFEGQDVVFLGINTSDSAAAAAAFAETYDVTYPSLITVDDRSVKLAFAEKTPIAATPTTLILDAEGRVAARLIGQVRESSILESMVKTVLAETS